MSATQTVPAVVPVAPGRRPSRGPSRGPTKAHKNADFVLESAENGGSEGQKRTKTSILCSKCPKMRVPDPKSAQKCRFCARGWLPRAQQRPPELSTTRHEPCGVHLAAVRQAINCRNLPRNLLLRPTCREYDRAYPRTTYLPLILPCIPPWRYPRATYPRACCRGILPCSGSRAQRAGDSDVGANDKGAGDDPGDGVDAH